MAGGHDVLLSRNPFPNSPLLAIHRHRLEDGYTNTHMLRCRLVNVRDDKLSCWDFGCHTKFQPVALHCNGSLMQTRGKVPLPPCPASALCSPSFKQQGPGVVSGVPQSADRPILDTYFVDCLLRSLGPEFGQKCRLPPADVFLLRIDQGISFPRRSSVPKAAKLRRSPLHVGTATRLPTAKNIFEPYRDGWLLAKTIPTRESQQDSLVQSHC
ncbi:hypothetical protein LX36DRAFT_650220 [Colletotrichum falcatum]|nr:hypothetical protein LX36DRAFT_650220 [Colletotrichum falcatum]